MTRGTRLFLMMLVLVGVIFLMMDCAKRSMRKQHQPAAPEGAPQSSSAPAFAPGHHPVRA